MLPSLAGLCYNRAASIGPEDSLSLQTETLLMPSLFVPMEPLCHLTFTAQMKMLPLDWQQPQGDPDAQQYNDAFEPAQHMAIPEPACYFWAQSTNEYHVDTCKDIGKLFKDLATDILGAVSKAIDLWRAQAKFKDLKVNGPTALGTPGCLDGPSIESNIKNFSRPAASGNEKDWRDACAAGISKCFEDWQGKVMVPGLPWYPAFACFPGPMAPPMPNIPMPLQTCPSPMQMKMTPTMLKNAMCDNFSLDDPDDQFGAFAMALGTAIAASFTAWLPAQQVMAVLGKGQIPTFWPPYVPVGPVVMGDNIPTPGHNAV